jgi:hypothetical protein
MVMVMTVMVMAVVMMIVSVMAAALWKQCNIKLTAVCSNSVTTVWQQFVQKCVATV